MTVAEPFTDADINVCFDPLRPFAWMTSKWVRLAAHQRDYRARRQPSAEEVAGCRVGISVRP
jgi:hypothetical protein